MPRSPVEGFIVPKNAIAATSTMCCAFGNAIPLAIMNAAPSSSRLRMSWRAPRWPISRVANDVPSSAAVATMPIWKASKPISAKYAGRIMTAKPSPNPRAARAA